MFTEITNPAEIAAAIESAPDRRKRIASESASYSAPTTEVPPLASNPLAEGQAYFEPHCVLAFGNPITQDAAIWLSETNNTTPHPECPDFPPYTPEPHVADLIDIITTKHRLRQEMIKAQTSLVLKAKASIRFAVHQDGDYDTDESKKAARKRADALYRAVAKDPTHDLYGNILPYLAALEPLNAARKVCEREMVAAAKQLPIFAWAQSVKGFGDVSFATIVGECGDVGTYRSHSALWKRLGLAVLDGKRQGAPGDGASKEDWIRHGYKASRRSVSWNMRKGLIGGMGLWRPVHGEDVQANPGLTYYQRLYAERARYESGKLGLPITCSDKGKESYKKHVANRAHRYVEKRLLRELYRAWRHGL